MLDGKSYAIGSLCFSFNIVNAPDGQVCTAEMISAVIALPIETHGLTLGLNTWGRFFTQLPE